MKCDLFSRIVSLYKNSFPNYQSTLKHTPDNGLET